MTTTDSPARAIEIDIWADIACPWCYIGKRRLQTAMDQVRAENPAAQFLVRYHAFLLDPYAKPADGRTEADVLALKFGDRGAAIKALSQVTQVAAQEGLTFDFDALVPTTTRPALQMLAYAASAAADRQAELAEALYRAHFSEGQDVADVEVLIAAAADIGIGEDEARRALDSDEAADAVQRDLAQATELGITGVPFFVLDGKYSASGAQPAELFLRAFQDLQEA
ncbi:protein disulfide isomerase FrnE [Rarobacter faecitabidus]|uniref:Putative DsbA family dithiol-disulfide isomerase n=1 Tax=Rarobacter faecitabidus TaxID=13243 RepID=A0A542Z9Z0_RARFA|nr:DsbA family oxidoreductase [Rarobacter faecitabidus]TQL57158.1 putative DsbA family dithiol-disulfide isomerase [Rarobacter faecitabidus]